MKKSDEQFIYVLIERYHLKMGTFYFLWGELEITLSEFSTIIELHFDGEDLEIKADGPLLMQWAFHIHPLLQELGKPGTSLQFTWVEHTLFLTGTVPPTLGSYTMKR